VGGTEPRGSPPIPICEVKQKISGGFRCIAGATDFATIRSFIATAKKQGWNVV
jgi:transposase